MPEVKKPATGKAILELVDKMHEEKKISREVIFTGIEAAIKLAAERQFAVEEGVLVMIDRATGDIAAKFEDRDIDPMLLGRIAAQAENGDEDRRAEIRQTLGKSGKRTLA